MRALLHQPSSTSPPTRRSDSTIVAPYERWEYYTPGVHSLPLQRNFAANKTKQVAWFVSNCGARCACS